MCVDKTNSMRIFNLPFRWNHNFNNTFIGELKISWFAINHKVENKLSLKKMKKIKTIKINFVLFCLILFDFEMVFWGEFFSSIFQS